MKIVRGVLLFLGLLCVGGGGLLVWVQGVSGERYVSRALTREIQTTLPGGEVDLKGIRVRGWNRAEILSVRLRGSAAETLVCLNGLGLTMRSWPKRQWEIQGQAEAVDLEALDRRIGQGRWLAHGTLAGPFHLWGTGERIERMEVRLDSVESGGRLGSGVLKSLLALMPADDTRALLLRAIGASRTFHFLTGRAALRSGPEGSEIRLQLDGDHLLDITVRLPAEGWRLLKRLIPE